MLSNSIAPSSASLPYRKIAILLGIAMIFSSKLSGQESIPIQETNSTQPNVVILYSDDAGYADFGFQPDCAEDIRSLTPHIDSIARDGVRFTNAYMSGCVCSPSRAGLMTGRYQGRFGFDNNIPPGTQSGLSLDETFGPKRLQNLGYKTGLVGKWHLGYPDAYHPNERGFDWFYGLLKGSRSYYPIKNVSKHRVILENRTPTAEEGYITDRFGDAAVRFINKNKDEAFFLFVSFTAPHSPNQPNKNDLERIRHIENKQRQNFAGLLVSLDDNIGKILKAIEANGIADNTIVIFTNDNGGQTATGANNGKLRGKKGTLWEGGVRIPWAMRWPSKIKPNSVIDTPTISLDILPTIINAAGHSIRDEWQLDGRSFLPLLTGKSDSLPTRTLFWRQHGSQGSIALRHDNWKLIHNRSEPQSKPQLFDLEQDLGEENDLATQHPDLVADLVKKLEQWEQELEQPKWGPGSVRDKKTKRKKQK